MGHILRIYSSTIVCLLGLYCLTQAQTGATRQDQKKKLLYEADFSRELDTAIWKIEMDKQPNSSVYTKGGKLMVDSYGGTTIWLNKKLKGNVEILYRRKVIVDGGPNDRLSDLNQFWMASDPDNANIFTRTGKLAEYDELQLYYMGMGGNHNTTTRFRKYDGVGNRVLLKEYLDKKHLLKANHTYEVKTQVRDGETSVWIDGRLFFRHKDPHPLTSGYFGIRSTYARQSIEDFKIYQIHN